MIENFVTPEECDELKSAILSVIDGLDVEKEHKSVFSTRDNDQVYMYQAEPIIKL